MSMLGEAYPGFQSHRRTENRSHVEGKDALVPKKSEKTTLPIPLPRTQIPSVGATLVVARSSVVSGFPLCLRVSV